MIATPLVCIAAITSRRGHGEGLAELALDCVRDFRGEKIGGVIAATFSGERRFPSLAVQIAASLGLPPSTPAFDLQMACSAYPYAVYLAGRLAADLGQPVLVVDGDVQSRLTDVNDHATGRIFSDAVTGSLVRAEESAKSHWTFLSQYDEALECPSAGPIAMDGLKVFGFVAKDVSRWLGEFLREADVQEPFAFCPHQANAYMIRQLARSLKLEERLVTLPEEWKNPGSCSIPLALQTTQVRGTALIAAFGAGYSAAAGFVKIVG